MSRRRPVVLALALAGALAGVAAKAADASAWRWAEDLGHYPAAWLLAVAVVARLSPTAASAAARSAVFFAAMTAAYYGWADVVQGTGPAVWRLAVWWWALSVTAVPLFAAAVRTAALARRGPAAPLAGTVLAMAGGLGLAQGPALGRPVQVAAAVVAALVVAVVLPVARRTRTWAVVLLAPGALLASAALALATGRVLP